jgi:hypothetical protein
MTMTPRQGHRGAIRRALFAAAALAALLASSCQLPVIVGLHSTFTQASTASTSIEVIDSLRPLRLSGTAQVQSGGLRVRLTPPHGGDVFDQTLVAGFSPIDEAYPNPVAGSWQLSVESQTGVGRYDLELSY